MKKQTGILRNIFSHTLFIANLLVILWSGLCYAAAYINPVKIKYLAIFNLTLPFVIVANLFFVVFWLIFSHRRLRFLFSTITLLAGYKVFLTVFGLNFFTKNDITSHEHNIKILSWNVHGLGLYERHDGKETAQKILNYIKEQNADIVCMPEYYTPKSDSMKPYAKQILSYGYSEYKFCFDNTLGPSIYLGTAVFSKYPLEDYKVYHLGTEWINVIQCDVNIKEGKKMRFIFLHLHSFDLSDYDKYYIEELKKKGLSIPTRSDVFLWKLNYAYSVRGTEADTVASIISRSPYPVYVCGDFNDLPGSYTYMSIRGKLDDAFLNKGKWIGRTYNELSPTIRIDHMFYDPGVLEILGYKSPPILLSDHRPLIANYKIL